jgi:hypothetical protein
VVTIDLLTNIQVSLVTAASLHSLARASMVERVGQLHCDIKNDPPAPFGSLVRIMRHDGV